MSLASRVVLALLFGLVGYGLVWSGLHPHPRFLAKDFTWPWRAARILLQGHDPYQVIQDTGPFPFSSAFFYPLPAALVALPVSPLAPDRAGAIFFGVSSAILAFAVTRDSFARLLLFASAPYMMAAVNVQWSPLLLAGALLPAVQWLGVAKPNLGLVAFLYRPSWSGVFGGALLLAASLVVLPTWPLGWRDALTQTPHHAAPLLRLGGPILLLALASWRSREARLLLTMACVPQVLYFYDQLMLWLVPRSWRGLIFLTVTSWIGWTAWWHRGPYESGGMAFAAPFVLGFLYAPALLVVLWEGRGTWLGWWSRARGVPASTPATRLPRDDV